MVMNLAQAKSTTMFFFADVINKLFGLVVNRKWAEGPNLTLLACGGFVGFHYFNGGGHPNASG